MESSVSAPTVKLRLYALEDDNDEVIFALGRGRNHELGDGVKLKGQNLQCPAGRPVQFEFKLKDHSDLDLEFDCEDPLWVQQGSECPEASCKDLVVELVSSSSHKVTIVNRGNLGDYAYVLRLVDEDGNRHSFDPVILNRS